MKQILSLSETMSNTKVCKLGNFSKSGDCTAKWFGTYTTSWGRVCNIYVLIERFEDKYYMYVGEVGHALHRFEKRIRKTMTMGEINALATQIYIDDDETMQKINERTKSANGFTTAKCERYYIE